MQAYAPELNLSIGPRTDDHRWETDRPGFTVHAEAQGTGKEALAGNGRIRDALVCQGAFKTEEGRDRASRAG